AEDGIRDGHVTGVQTCALPIFGFNDQLNLNGWNGGVSLPDLYEGLGVAVDISGHYTGEMEEYNFLIGPQYSYKLKGVRFYGHGRSEERRVGKEWRSSGSWYEEG